MWSNTNSVEEVLCNIIKNVFCFYNNTINTLKMGPNLTKSEKDNQEKMEIECLP